MKLRFENSRLSGIIYLIWYVFNILYIKISIFKAQRDW